jgi:hypothetical protein
MIHSFRHLNPLFDRHITVDSLNVDRDNPTSESFMPNAHNFSVQNLTVAETYVQNNYHSAQGDFTRATEPVSELAPAKRVNLECEFAYKVSQFVIERCDSWSISNQINIVGLFLAF